MEKTTWKTKEKKNKTTNEKQQKKENNKNTHVKACYLTYELEKKEQKKDGKKKMHSQSKQTTTKNTFKMRACILKS